MKILGWNIGRTVQAQAKSVDEIVGRDPRGWSLLSGNWPSQWTDGGDLFQPLSIEDMEQAFSNPIVHACVDEISSSIAQCDLELGAYMPDGEWVVKDVHPVLDLLDEPNNFQGQYEMLQAWSIRLELCGISYIRKFRAPSGVKGLLPYPTSWINPMYSGRGMQIVNAYKVRGEEGLVAPEDFIVGQYTSPDKVWGGCSPLNAASRDLALDTERSNYIAEMLLNLKVAGLIIIGKSGINARNRERIKDDINNTLGRGHRGSPLLIEGDAKVNMQNPLKDMDWPNYSDSVESRICMSYGMPPIIIGSRLGISKATYANYATARKSLYQETLQPKWVAMQQMLTRGLLRSEREHTLQFRFRFDRLPEFQEDLNTKSTRIQGEYRAGIIPKRTAQIELGYDPDEQASIEEEEYAQALARAPQLLAPENADEEDDDSTDEEEDNNDE